MVYTIKATPSRAVYSFWPFLLWTLPIAAVYGLGVLGLSDLCGRTYNEAIAMPLVFVSAVSYGWLAWKKHNEFAMALAVLSTGFFAREWHFAGTSTGVYIVAAGVAGWFLYRRRRMSQLIKNSPVEIWLWATGLCYVMSQVIARRVFSSDHLGWLPMEETYHIAMEETTETMAHLMLALTSLAAWRWFGAAEGQKMQEVQADDQSLKPLHRAEGIDDDLAQAG